MKSLPPAMQAKLENGLTQFCHCWRITRSDGKVICLTNHDADLHFDDLTFEARAAMRFSVFETRLGLAAHGPEASGRLGSDLLEADDLQAGLFDDAAFQIWLVDWQQPENRLLMMSGYFGPVRLEEGRFRVSLRGVGQQLNQKQGRVYQTHCDAALGDARCQIDLDNPAYGWRGKVLARQGVNVFVPLLDYAKNWFVDGTIRHAQARHMVREDIMLADSRQLVLWQNPPPALTAGSHIILTAGCDKRLTTCHAKFANSVNFQGFPDLTDGRALVDVRASS